MFERGQPIVCIKTHSRGVVKEGELHVNKNMKIDCCGDLLLDVGVKSDERCFGSGINRPIGSVYYCAECGKENIVDGIWWLDASVFRPLDDLYNTEIEELMEEVNQTQPFELR